MKKIIVLSILATLVIAAGSAWHVQHADAVPQKLKKLAPD